MGIKPGGGLGWATMAVAEEECWSEKEARSGRKHLKLGQARQQTRRPSRFWDGLFGT